MNVLFFSDSRDKALNDSLLGIIRSKNGGSRLEPVDHIDALRKRLHRLPRGIDIAVLVARDQQQLAELTGLKDYLDGIPLILILPDQDKGTISHATKLYPNFIGSVDGDFSLVSDVLGKMLNVREKRYLMKRT